MKVLRLIASLALLPLIHACSHAREGGELRLKHEVTVTTPQGDRTFTSVVSMSGYQTYNYGAGTSGWGGITCRLTGNAVRVVLDDKDYYFLLTDRGTTAAWSQIDLIKKFFGLPNGPNDASWVDQWKSLAASNLGFAIPRSEYPTIAVMPHDGWMDDARIVTLDEAEQQGLHIKSYRLQITQEPVGPDLKIRYRPADARDHRMTIGREAFTAVNATA